MRTATLLSLFAAATTTATASVCASAALRTECEALLECRWGRGGCELTDILPCRFFDMQEVECTERTHCVWRPPPHAECVDGDGEEDDVEELEDYQLDWVAFVVVYGVVLTGLMFRVSLYVSDAEDASDAVAAAHAPTPGRYSRIGAVYGFREIAANAQRHATATWYVWLSARIVQVVCVVVFGVVEDTYAVPAMLVVFYAFHLVGLVLRKFPTRFDAHNVFRSCADSPSPGIFVLDMVAASCVCVVQEYPITLGLSVCAPLGIFTTFVSYSVWKGADLEDVGSETAYTIRGIAASPSSPATSLLKNRARSTQEASDVRLLMNAWGGIAALTRVGLLVIGVVTNFPLSIIAGALHLTLDLYSRYRRTSLEIPARVRYPGWILLTLDIATLACAATTNSFPLTPTLALSIALDIVALRGKAGIDSDAIFPKPSAVSRKKVRFPHAKTEPETTPFKVPTSSAFRTPGSAYTPSSLTRRTPTPDKLSHDGSYVDETFV